MLIAEAGSGKTEMLSSLEGITETCPIDTVSPKTFLSGYERGDKGQTSLLKRLGNPIFTIEDFGTVLSTRLHDQREIMGQLRKIYDGKYSKDVGSEKESIVWRGKVTLLAACTTAIDANQGGMTSQELGERFIDYRYNISDHLAVTEAALRQNGTEAETRSKRMSVVNSFIKGYNMQMTFPQKPGPKLHKGVLDRLPALANFAALCRSAVPRDPYTHEISRQPQREIGTRLVKQLSRLGESLLLVNKEIDVWPILYKVAMDCMPPLRWKALQALSTPCKTNKVLEALRLPRISTLRVLQDLQALEIVEATGNEVNGYTWGRLLWIEK